MYSNYRVKRKEPEINELRCAPMDPQKFPRPPANVPHTVRAPPIPTNVQPVPPVGRLDPSTLTQHYQNLQYYNYMIYIQQMRQATGISENIVPSFEPSPQFMKLTPVADLNEFNKPKLPSMTYGEHRRLTQYGEESSQESNKHSQKAVSADDGWGNETFESGPSQRPSNYRREKESHDPRSKQPKTDDGWGDSPVKPAKTSGDWDDAKPSKTSYKKGKDDWSDEEKPVKAREGSHNSYESRSFSRDRSSSSRGRETRDGSSQRTYEKRQPRDGDWECSKCHASTNFHFRTECFRCKEPKDENAKVVSGSNGGSSRGGYQKRSYDGNFTQRSDSGGYRGGRGGSSYRGRGGNNSGSWRGNQESKSTEKVSSGWSDEESDSKKTTTEKPKDDGWDEPVEKKAATSSGAKADDDWDFEDKPAEKKVSTSNGDGASASKALDEDEWGAPKVAKTVATNEKINDDDDWGPAIPAVANPPTANSVKVKADDDWED